MGGAPLAQMRRTLAVLFAALFIDQMDAGMLLPVLPALLTNPESPAFLLSAGPDAKQTGELLIAVLGAAYAVPAFLSQPILGQLADRRGRRPLLLLAFAGSALSYVLFAVGVMAESVWVLVASRAVDGLTAGNVIVGMAALADVTEDDERTRFFGYFTAALSLGFVVGPLLGGFLGDPEGAGWTGPATAFWVAAGLNAVVVGLFALLFKETLDDDDRGADDGFEVGRAFSNARDAARDDGRRATYLLLLFYVAGYTFYSTFYNVVLEDRVGMDTAGVGVYFAVLGLGFMAVQVFVVDRVERRFGDRRALGGALALTAVAVALSALATAPWMAYALIPLFALGNGLIDPLVSSILSRSADGATQGRVQGVRGSVDALGRAAPPFVAGPLAAAGSPVWPVLLGAGFVGGASLVAWLVGAKGNDVMNDDEGSSGGEDSADGSADGSASDGSASDGADDSAPDDAGSDDSA